MTNDEILQLTKTCGFGTYTNDDGTPSDYFDCYSEQLLKFAREIYEEGYERGRYAELEIQQNQFGGTG